MAKTNQQRKGKGKSRRRVRGFLKRLSCASPPSTASVSRSSSQSLSSAALASPPSLGSSPSQLPALCPPVLEVATLTTSIQQSATLISSKEIPAEVSPLVLGPDSLQLPASPLSVLEVPMLPFSSNNSQQSTKSLTIWEEVFRKVNKETTEWIQKQGLNSLASAAEKPEDRSNRLLISLERKKSHLRRQTRQ